MEERLCIGIHGDELDAVQLRFDHPIHGVTSPAANPNDLYLGKVLAAIGDVRFKHALVLPLRQPAR
jgi:hypothetical protein